MTTYYDWAIAPDDFQFFINSLFAGNERGYMYDFSDITTQRADVGTIPVTQPNGTVGMVMDLSGNNNHLKQATSGLRPTSTLINGNRFLRFNGANWMQSDVTTLNNANFYLAVLARENAAKAFPGIVVHSIAGQNDFSNANTLVTNFGDTAAPTTHAAAQGLGGFNINQQGARPSALKIIEVHKVGTALTVYVDGVQIGTATVAALANAALNITVGARVLSSGLPAANMLNGDLMAALCTGRAVTLKEREGTRAWLNGKYTP